MVRSTSEAKDLLASKTVTTTSDFSGSFINALRRPRTTLILVKRWTYLLVEVHAEKPW